MRSDTKKTREVVDPGSGDVFRDLGFEGPGEHRLRARLALRLNELIVEMGWTQTRVADRLGISQPHVSDLKHYRLSRFSSERLLRFLIALDQEVEIRVRPRRKRQPREIRVSIG